MSFVYTFNMRSSIVFMVILVSGTLIVGTNGFSQCEPLNVENPLTINVTSAVQNLSTPQYPNNYDSNLNCYWLLHLDHGQTVHMYLQTHDVKCGDDYVIIYNGPIATSGTKYNGCWGNETETIINTTKSTGVRFQSNSRDNGKGFLLFFSENKQALTTHVAGLESGTGNGNGGGSGNTNNTGGTNGTLGGTNSSTRLANKDVSVLVLCLVTTVVALQMFFSLSQEVYA